MASIFGRTNNIKFWLSRFPNWNLERKNKVNGACALSCAAHMGPCRLEIVKLLLAHGASPAYRTTTGSSILNTISGSEDSDPELLCYLLNFQKKKFDSVNRQVRGNNLKWRTIRRLACFMTRNKLTNSGLLQHIAHETGATPLYHAVRRGDIDVVNILLQHGADPAIKNDLGKSSIDYCNAFPELRGALKRVIHRRKNKIKSVTLHRRDSTASDLKFPMYLIPLDQMQIMYGGKEARHHRIEAHQDLKQRGELVRWEDLPFDAHIIFVSHEWVGWSHPDPHGIQLKTFLKVMQCLCSGEIDRVEMNVFHTLLYKHNLVTTHEEWKEMLSNTFVWFDWASMPQPSASPDLPKAKRDEMGADLGNAVKSIPAYVERSDFIAIVASGCLHADRRDPETKHRAKICFRTYRNRGWCVLEIFASYLSRDKTHPALLITSKSGMPEWISSMEAQKLAVGVCDFTCCQRNHTFGNRIVPCDRGITRLILEKLIESKVQHLFKTNDMKLARLFHCLRQWWLRGSDVNDNSVSTLKDFKSELRWSNEEDGQDQSARWIDQTGFSILAYAVFKNNLCVVKEILQTFQGTIMCLLSWRFPREGIIEIAWPGHATCLQAAMFASKPEIVIALLEAGASPKDTNIAGLDAFKAACVSGRLENVKVWLKKFPNWNVDCRGSVFGSTALNIAARFGQRKFELIKFLIEEAGASVRCISNSGSNLLLLAAENQDADPKVIRYLLNRHDMFNVNMRSRSQSLKWRLIRGVARFATQTNMSQSALLKTLAEEGGITPLHCAAKRGDLEIVEILMEFGAKASVKNDLGHDILSFCQAFPEIKGAIKRVQREMKRKKSSTAPTSLSQKPSKQFSLQRSTSTAISVEYDMYLISLEMMLSLFGSSSDRKTNFNLCHQRLLKKGELTRFEDLPMGTFTIFISHEWLSRNHPDPSGTQLSTLCRVLRDLRDGKIERVSMDIVHYLTYKHNFSTSAKEWKDFLANAYIWFDWWSQPQPNMENVGTSERSKCENDLAKALRSTAAYVERCDCMMILAPSGAIHHDRVSTTSGRKAFACYRTWRRRAFCVLEFFASYLSRRQAFPVLLVQSATQNPKWISAVEAQKLSVGMSNFSCCEMNHPNSMLCDKISLWDVLNSMIQSKVKYDYDVLDDVVDARFTFALGSWWKRGLETSHENVVSSLKDFKKHLRWDTESGDDDFIDREGVSLLMYAAANGNLKVVTEILQLISASDKEKRISLIDHRVRREGYADFGILGQTNALFAAMSWGTPEIVELLLKSGADSTVKDRVGADPFIYACYNGRNSNVKFWLKHYKDCWDIERGIQTTGANALTLALSEGPHKLEIVKMLLNSGVDVNRGASSGVTNLMAACSNEDSDPEVVSFLLSFAACDPNVQARPRGFRWITIRHVSKMMTKLRIAKRGGFVEHLAKGLGTTALHYGARRGDVEIVELLLKRGASPNIKNSLGMDAASTCASFPELRDLLTKQHGKKK